MACRLLQESQEMNVNGRCGGGLINGSQLVLLVSADCLIPLGALPLTALSARVLSSAAAGGMSAAACEAG